MEQIPTKLNEPLSKLLWYAKEAGQNKKIWLRDVVEMIRNFFLEHERIIGIKVSRRSLYPQPSASSSSTFQVLTVKVNPKESPNLCMLCHQREDPNSLHFVINKNLKLLLATGWMLMSKCNVADAKEIANKVPATVCDTHFAEIIAQMRETLGITSEQELESCSVAQRQKLLSAVNLVDLDIRASSFWEFLLIWNRENLKYSKKSLTQNFRQLPRILQISVCCSICRKNRRKQDIRYIKTDTERLIVLTGSVLNNLCSIAEAKACLPRKFLSVCSEHRADASDAILKVLKKTSDPTWMDSVVPVVSALRPDLSKEMLSEILRELMLRTRDFRKT